MADRVRWFIKMTAPETLASSPPQAELLPALRVECDDDSLCCISQADSGFILTLEGFIGGFVRAYERQQSQRPWLLCGCPVASIEPIFDRDYVEQIRVRELATMRCFIRIYGPLFVSVVQTESRRYSKVADASAEEQLLADVWHALMEKLEHVLTLYKPDKGSQMGYLRQVVIYLARDLLRQSNRRKEYLVEPHQFEHIRANADLHELVERRDFVQKVMEEFRRDCAASPQRAVPDDWELCELFYLKAMSKEQVCEKYPTLKSSNFDVRIMRIKKRLLAIIQKLSN